MPMMMETLKEYGRLNERKDKKYANDDLNVQETSGGESDSPNQSVSLNWAD
jgi:hypothetical protein